MCQYYIQKYGRQCFGHGDPYCAKHRNIPPSIAPIRKPLIISAFTLVSDDIEKKPIPVVKNIEPVTTTSKIDESVECGICMESTKEYTKTICNHVICDICLIRGAVYKCPFCRKDLTGTLSPKIGTLIDYIACKDKKIAKIEAELIYKDKIIKNMKDNILAIVLQ